MQPQLNALTLEAELRSVANAEMPNLGLTAKWGQPRFRKRVDETRKKVEVFAVEGSGRRENKFSARVSWGRKERGEVVSGAGLNSHYKNKVSRVIPGHRNVTVPLHWRGSPHTASQQQPIDHALIRNGWGRRCAPCDGCLRGTH